ncbi:DUF262 domain-containing protein [Azotosporobacter soli]|uniref:DUF262 domain-containing protein n=1 Tax=Azotosporobacter soli TaxID=3055040 RepID=UPI0031FE595F
MLSSDEEKKEIDEMFENESEEDLIEDEIAESDRRLVTTAYDFIVRSLKDQIADETIIVDATWQRKYVWDDIKASKLIESLILNVPIPVCYFAEEEKSGQYLVIDGQQRLWSIFRYLNNEFSLRGLITLGHLNKKRFHELDTKYQRLISTRAIRCIILTSECHPELRFDVFERLNYGSVPLNPQELRHCIYRGAFSDLLAKLVEDRTWLNLIGKKESDERLRDQELILRFLALHFRLSKYKPSLKTFLNSFMRDHKRMSKKDETDYKALFDRTTSNLWKMFGENAFRRHVKKSGEESYDKNINKALFDLQMLVASHLEINCSDLKIAKIRDVFFHLMHDDKFIDLILRATDHRTRVVSRCEMLREKLIDNGIKMEELFEKIESMSKLSVEAN